MNTTTHNRLPQERLVLSLGILTTTLTMMGGLIFSPERGLYQALALLLLSVSVAVGIILLSVGATHVMEALACHSPSARQKLRNLRTEGATGTSFMERCRSAFAWGFLVAVIILNLVMPTTNALLLTLVAVAYGMTAAVFLLGTINTIMGLRAVRHAVSA